MVWENAGQITIVLGPSYALASTTARLVSLYSSNIVSYQCLAPFAMSCDTIESDGIIKASAASFDNIPASGFQGRGNVLSSAFRFDHGFRKT